MFFFKFSALRVQPFSQVPDKIFCEGCFREQIFLLKAKNGFSYILISIEGVKMRFRILTEKYSVDSAFQFPTLFDGK